VPQNSTEVAQHQGWEEVSEIPVDLGMDFIGLVCWQAMQRGIHKYRAGEVSHYSWPGALFATPNTSDLGKISHFL